MSTLQTIRTTDRNFDELLRARWAEGKFVCMGLDPTWGKIPLSVPGRFEGDDQELLEEAIAYYNFCTLVVDATHDLVAAYKPNTAFFEAAGGAGYDMLRLLIRHINRVAPGVLVIVDAKRGDIGKTNIGSVRMIFDILGADAVTVNPYFGFEALQPFLDRTGKGVIILCRTSNPGAGVLQNRLVDVGEAEMLNAGLDGSWERMPLYQFLALQARQWQSKAAVAVVVGATAPDELAEVRIIMPETVILIPGVGAQGGDLQLAVQGGMTTSSNGFLVNAGSKALYASSGADFAQATRSEVIEMNRDIGALLVI